MSVGHDGRGVGGGPAVVAGAGLVSGAGRTAEGYCHGQLLDAVRYLVAGGISWRAMPADFPAWARVYAFFRRWREHGLITEFHDRLRGKVREREGREAEPTAGIIGAQSVVGANALVTQGTVVPPGSMVLGSPAKVVRTLAQADRETLRNWAQKYVENAAYCLKNRINLGAPLPTL